MQGLPGAGWLATATHGAAAGLLLRLQPCMVCALAMHQHRRLKACLHMHCPAGFVAPGHYITSVAASAATLCPMGSVAASTRARAAALACDACPTGTTTTATGGVVCGAWHLLLAPVAGAVQLRLTFRAAQLVHAWKLAGSCCMVPQGSGSCCVVVPQQARLSGGQGAANPFVVSGAHAPLHCPPGTNPD